MQAEQIEQYAQKEKIVTIEEIMVHFHVQKEEQNALRIILHRLCEKKVFHRYENGVYGYNSYNPFAGKNCAPPEYEVVNKIYLGDGTGYVSGGHYLNSIGMTTWCPAKRIIVSNKVKRGQEKYGTFIKCPKTRITEKNRDYLQLLDGIEDAADFPVDCENPDAVLFGLIAGKNVAYLLFLARNYYKNDTVKRVIQIIANQHEVFGGM